MGEMRDPDLTDETLQGEIELVGDLVVAASGSQGPMSEEDIDRVLGISAEATPPEDGAEASEHPRVTGDGDDAAAGPQGSGEDPTGGS